MPMTRLPLDSLQIFERAARRLSFQAAAAELNLTPAAVSQRIRQLEDRLACRLFQRLTRQVVLTEEGQLLAARLQAPLAGIAAAVGALKATRDRPLTLSTTATFAQQCLFPVLADFQLAHPDLPVRVLVDNGLADLTGGEVDIGVRQGMGHYPGLDSLFLFPGRYLPVSTPAVAARAATAALIHVVWPAAFPDPPTWAAWMVQHGRALAEGPGSSVPFESVAVQAALAGQGIALVHERHVAPFLAQGQLVPTFGPGSEVTTSASHYLVRARAPRSAGAEALWHWLAAAFRQA